MTRSRVSEMQLEQTDTALENFNPFNAPIDVDRLKEVAKKELGETEELKEECLEQLRRLINGMWNPSHCGTEDMVLYLFLLLNYVVEKQSSQITGMVVLADTKILHLFDMFYVLRNARAVKNFAIDCMPLRYTKIHVINESWLARYMFRLLDPMMPKKFRERFLFHGERREVLLQYISPTILPEDFGGNSAPSSSDHLAEEMIDYVEKLKEEQHYFLRQNGS